MKNSVRTLAALMTAVCVLGCSKEADNHIEEPAEKEKEPVVIEKVPMTFSVGTAKTVLIPQTGQIGFHKVDKISIFDCNGDNNDFVNDASNDGQLEVKFSGKAAKSDIYYALYPYQKNAQLTTKDNITNITGVVLPATQTATVNSFDPKANISVAVTQNTSLTLMNVCSLFKIVVNAGEHYDKAVISSNDGSSICGTLSIDFDTDKNPVVGKNITDGSPSVTLSGAMGDDTEQTVYYAVILPKTYDNGISVKLYNSEKQTTPLAMRASSPSTKIERAKIATFGHIKPDLLSKEFTIDKDGGKVRFSKGNLWCNASADEASKWIWALEENQYDSNTGTQTGQQRTYNNTHVSHFYYSANGLEAGDNGYGAGPNRISGQESGVNIGLVFGQDSKWTVLEKDEMKYLLETRKTGATVGTTTNARYSPIKVNGKEGYMIFPDNFNWDESKYGNVPTKINQAGAFKDYTDTFVKLEEDGVVFLPQNGFRNGEDIKYAEQGYPVNYTYGYYSYLDAITYVLAISSGTVKTDKGQGSGNAYSVRLVKHISSTSN